MAAEDAIATGTNAAHVADSAARFVAVGDACTEGAKGVAGEKPWPTACLTNDEAVELLRGAKSGLKPSLSRYGYRAFKRTFDVCASGLGIVVLLIPAAVLSAAICIKSPGAGPLYSQVRIGRLKKDGSYSLFRMWKFRSMVPNADALLKDLQDKNEADGPLFKIKADPRIIPGLGHFIRKHSIDELPQLLNVFCGQIPLRILKMRQEFSVKCMGAFALPAKSSTNEEKVFSQVAISFVSGLRKRRCSGFNSSSADGTKAQFLAKPVFGAVCA